MWRGLLCGAALMCSLSRTVSRSRPAATAAPSPSPPSINAALALAAAARGHRITATTGTRADWEKLGVKEADDFVALPHGNPVCRQEGGWQLPCWAINKNSFKDSETKAIRATYRGAQSISPHLMGEDKLRWLTERLDFELACYAEPTGAATEGTWTATPAGCARAFFAGAGIMEACGCAVQSKGVKPGVASLRQVVYATGLIKVVRPALGGVDMEEAFGVVMRGAGSALLGEAPTAGTLAAAWGRWDRALTTAKANAAGADGRALRDLYGKADDTAKLRVAGASAERARSGGGTPARGSPAQEDAPESPGAASFAEVEAGDWHATYQALCARLEELEASGSVASVPHFACLEARSKRLSARAKLYTVIPAVGVPVWSFAGDVPEDVASANGWAAVTGSTPVRTLAAETEVKTKGYPKFIGDGERPPPGELLTL
jgi:hypothetical protein